MKNSARPVSNLVALAFLLSIFTTDNLAQKRRPPIGGRIAVVIDERLAALRESPALTGNFKQRISRGRLVAVRGERRGRDGVTYAQVNVTSRTSGWIQRDALVRPGQKGDDEKVLLLIRASQDFDRIARARIFLEVFPASRLRPAVLMILGDAAAAAATKLTREANRRLKTEELRGSGVPEFSFFLNYSGLDRYNRQGIRFGFDDVRRSFFYDGAAWKEILRRHPRSSEATEARMRLQQR